MRVCVRGRARLCAAWVGVCAFLCPRDACACPRVMRAYARTCARVHARLRARVRTCAPACTRVCACACVRVRACACARLRAQASPSRAAASPDALAMMPKLGAKEVTMNPIPGIKTPILAPCPWPAARATTPIHPGLLGNLVRNSYKSAAQFWGPIQWDKKKEGTTTR